MFKEEPFIVHVIIPGVCKNQVGVFYDIFVGTFCVILVSYSAFFK